jgi:hypothetical protein
MNVRKGKRQKRSYRRQTVGIEQYHRLVTVATANFQLPLAKKAKKT